MLKLTLVMATILLHVAASQPVDVNVEDMTVNGVKIPIGLDQPGKLSERAGMLPKKRWPRNNKGPLKLPKEFVESVHQWNMVKARRIKFDRV